MKRIIVTGGAGFIGSAVVRHLLAKPGYEVMNLDKLTYAANLQSLRSVQDDKRYHFAQIDVCDSDRVRNVFDDFRPHAVMHLAAESHVDRSIEGPEEFVQTNVVGTCRLLAEALRYWRALDSTEAEDFRFHHISTDEVFGELDEGGKFSEASPYQPNSPYAASKAAADHFVRAWRRTFDLPVVLSNCSNNYGPFHFPEKLIPLVIVKCLFEQDIPVYGQGEQVRDWLFVEDHARALEVIVQSGEVGESYNVGGASERQNIEVVRAICDALDTLRPRRQGSYRDLITFVADRPGHDYRYAIDFSKLRKSLGWQPNETFDSGLDKTVRWYLDNEWWWRPILEESYQGQRLGLANTNQAASG